MKDYRKLLNAINESCSPFSVLIIKKDGQLIRLHCPFKVMVLYDVNNLDRDAAHWVESVKISPGLLMLYVIRNVAYPYHFFMIIIE